MTPDFTGESDNQLLGRIITTTNSDLIFLSHTNSVKSRINHERLNKGRGRLPPTKPNLINQTRRNKCGVSFETATNSRYQRAKYHLNAEMAEQKSQHPAFQLPLALKTAPHFSHHLNPKNSTPSEI